MASLGTKSLTGSKFTRDLIWNYGAMAFVGFAGVAINVIIASHYGAEVLGVFNQIFAFYIVAAQFATGGLHFSTLKHVAEFADDREKCSGVVWAGAAVAAVLGLFVAVMVVLAGPAIGDVLESPSVGRGLVLSAMGLALIAVNKVLLAALNGLRRMGQFAAGNALRFAVMIGFVVIAVAWGMPGYALGATFTVAELAVAFYAAGCVVVAVGFRGLRELRRWMRIHIGFGAKAFLGGVLLEINPRIDVLMIGLFLSDKAVGIYSFAAMLAEGFLYLLAVVRNNVNPMLVPLLVSGRKDEIVGLVRRIRLYLCPAAFIVASAVLTLYPFAIEVAFGASSPYAESWPILAILSAGIVLFSAYVPFDAILSQAGLPGRHTLLTLLAVSANVVLNAVLIPAFGILGAASATAMAVVVQIVGLKLLARRFVGVAL